MSGFTILLPPSGTQQSGGNSLAPKMFDRRSSNTFNYFVGLNPERRQVIEAVNALEQTPSALAKVFGVKTADVERAGDLNRDVMSSPLMSALDRYSPGVMYAAMDFENLPTGAQRRLLEHGVIFSAMFGLLRPDDLVPEYYLDPTGNIPEIGKPLAFWTPFVTDELNRLVKGHYVWNLLPKKLAKIWTPVAGEATVIDVEFRRRVKGKYQPATKDLDKLAGGFVNMLVRGSADSVESLEELRHPVGFKIDLEASSIDEEAGTGRVVLKK